MLRVTWESEERTVATVGELDALLDQIHCEHQGDRAVLAQVEIEKSGDSLAIGLGRESSVLSFVSGSKDPPYYTSLGSEGERDDEPIVFRYMGQWSEFLRRNALPVEVAREAMRVFCRTGQLSSDVLWEQD